ncbi:SIMPL domain-containing protein [Salegentibacter mishustinae]|uniref:SIMPL domain-containing protein n=1 Tax=Salegentibacter mishustinae TaxID=270918 RepID=UPI001CE109E4|nr:SIMPL domain-containing protein [Salegentibacter mishustinae]UBZ06885.1 SIMPL domain-containing protein [Salegentibacter mishustinae]
MKKIILLFALVAGLGMQSQNDNSNPGIHVTGEGIVKVTPDKVTINSRIEHEGQSATSVKSQNDEVVDKVIKFLKSEGVAEKNINTDYINLNKRYNYNDKTYTYVASQAISITLEDISKYESIMKGLLENGLNGISGIEFESSEIEKHKAEARKRAVLNAKEKAEALAEPLGQRVGKAFMISEGSSSNYQPVYRAMEMKASADQASNQETIAPGEMEVNIKVNVAFQLLME